MYDLAFIFILKHSRNFLKRLFQSFILSLPPKQGQALVFIRHHGYWPNLKKTENIQRKSFLQKVK